MLFFFFNDTATTEIYTLSLHDALPISISLRSAPEAPPGWRLSHSQWRGSKVTSRATTPSVGRPKLGVVARERSEEHTAELQSHSDIVCRLLLAKKKQQTISHDSQWKRL